MKIKKKWKHLPGLLLLAGIFGYVLYRFVVEGDQFTLLSLNKPLFTAHCLLLIIFFSLLVLGWICILHSLKIPIQTQKAVASWLIPNAGKYVPGNVLMLGGRIEMVHHAGPRRVAAAMALTSEHVVMLLAAAPFTAYAILRGLHMPSGIINWLMGGGLLLCVILVLCPLLLVDGINKILTRLGKEPLSRDFSRPWFVAAFLVYLLAWSLYGGAGVLLIRAVVPYGQPAIVSVMTISVAAWMLGFCSLITPGGMGVREAVFAGFLSKLMPPAHALACALLFRLTWTMVEWGGVAIGLILNWVARNFKRDAENTVLKGGENAG